MHASYRGPDALAHALLSKPVSPERIRKLLRLAKLGTRAEFQQTLARLPADVRAEVERASQSTSFAG